VRGREALPRLRTTATPATINSTTLDTGLLPLRTCRPASQSLLLDDESDDPHPLELESSSDFELESHPPESSLSSSDESLLLHASATALHPSAAAGATLESDDPEPDDPDEPEPDDDGGDAGNDGALGVAGGGATGASHVVAYPAATTTGPDASVVASVTGTSPALAAVTIPSTRVTHTPAGASDATASAASSDVPPHESASTGAPPSSSVAHALPPGAIPSAPAGHVAT